MFKDGYLYKQYYLKTIGINETIFFDWLRKLFPDEESEKI